MKYKAFSCLRKYGFVIFPLVNCVLFIIFFLIGILKLNINNYSTLINVSATLLGFNFLLLTFLHSFDENRNFIKRLRNKKYFRILTTNIIVALIFYVLSLVVGIFEISIFFCTLFFILGLTNTSIACYFISKIAYHLSKPLE